MKRKKSTSTTKKPSLNKKKKEEPAALVPPPKQQSTPKKTTTTKKPSLKRKRKEEPPTQQSTPISSLPDDLLLSCFARLSRLYYPTLSLVSKSFRSHLASPELYKTRSSIGHTESCLYVCLRFPPDPIPRWFTLCRKPGKTLTANDEPTMKLKNKKKKQPSGYVLAKISAPHSGPAHFSSGLVTIGSDIYNIGGPIDDDEQPSSSVSILDCRSNTWREGPSMLLKRKFPAVSVLDGKIYVTGRCKDCTSPSDWMEVFDPKTQTWELVCAEICGSCTVSNSSAGIEGKVYVFRDCNGFSYEPSEGKWESFVGWGMYLGLWNSYAVIDNVVYHYDEGVFEWYDTKAGRWILLKGVKGLYKFSRYSAKLANYGGKLAVLFERVVAYKEKLILCAVIALERRNDEEIWGKVEWNDTVLTVPKSCVIEYAIAATV